MIFCNWYLRILLQQGLRVHYHNIKQKGKQRQKYDQLEKWRKEKEAFDENEVTAPVE